MSDYPEHAKLRKVMAQSQACGDFVKWLREEKGLVLARKHKHSEGCYDSHGHRICELEQDDLEYTWLRIESLLAEFFEIDEAKLEEEKCQLLEEQRRANLEMQTEALQDKGAG